MATRTPPVTPSCHHCLSPSRLRRPVDAPIDPTARYARMFPELPAFEADEAFLRALGRAGGICDCGDEADAPGSLSEVAAGWPIFGQFVAHDITADRSALQSHVDPHTLHNARRPTLDLECLYGDGPVGHPFLYQRDDPAKLLLGVDGLDVPRNADGIAIIGDPRNDSHMLVSQLHLAMLKVHNTFVDAARRRGVPEPDLFASAASETRLHYQWWVLREFLPGLVGQAMVDEVVKDRHRWFRPSDDVFIPLEFADAAYRYGHSQIRQLYRMNQATEPVPLFPDLLGFRPVPPRASHRLDALLRGTRHPLGAAGQEDRRSPGAVAHPPAGRDHGRVGGGGLSLAGGAGPSARPGRRPAVG